jgi:hypothetical protein
MKVKPLAVLLGLVLLMHWGSLSWLSGQVRGPNSLKLMTEPMFTRVIEQAAIVKPTIATVPAVAATPPSPSKKSKPQPQTLPKATPAPAPAEPPAPEPAVAETTLEVAVTPAPPAPEPAQASAEPADTWPPDTRLTYRLTGNYRGELTGSARVQWQRETLALGGTETARYQVQLAMSLSGVEVVSMTSQGKITEAGLLPEVYEEKLPGNVRRVTLDGNQIRFNNGRVDVRPTTVQDTASQFVELSHRFATGAETLKAGAEVRLWLARPGGLDFWTYDVLAPEILQTPELGAVEAFHLKPRPLSNPRGPIVAEMWFAPSLQYLPVRVRISLGDGNFVDLMVERIEQSERPKLNPTKESQPRDPT